MTRAVAPRVVSRMASPLLFALVAATCRQGAGHEHESEHAHDDEHDDERESPAQSGHGLAEGAERSASPAPSEPGAPTGSSDRRLAAAENVELLRVDAEMLRDLRLTTAPVRSRLAAETVAAPGEFRIDENRYAEVGTPIAARVVEPLVAPGDEVRPGQPLVELESVEVGRARAALASAHARLQLARRTVERRRALIGDGLVALRDLQAAEADLAQAEIELQLARETLAALGAGPGRGTRFRLRAPIAGTVVERHAIRGRLVEPSTTLFVIADLSRLWFVAHAFERDAIRIATGRRVELQLAALPATVVAGEVTAIGTRIDPSSRTVDVRIEVDNEPRRLRPGMSGTVLLPVGEADQPALVVPAAALQRTEAGWSVFVPRDARTFEVRLVGRGRDLDGGEVEVLSGLRAGETVVVDGAFLLEAERERRRGGADEHGHAH
ncbi:MAG: efflux RND transporter periplasmic adaptor subunit [Myxococcota bacterium]|nr:efflux RND transporter periplasmic adaptor subunit [Myxococcota bacterium]MDW8363138.1 efflux RND transporter periplasmic adaptor subunit [Myxococcales bacterium]